MPEEPKIHSISFTIHHGTNCQMIFKGEQYKGLDILDTKVEIDKGTLCWISWKDREAFTKELIAVIDKYAI